MSKYKNWTLLEKLPDNWVIDKTAGSPLHGYEFCTNGKSVLNGQERALVKIEVNIEKSLEREYSHSTPKKEEPPKQLIDSNYLLTVNILARKKFEERLLKDLLIDLTICEIEGWDKKEYIKELKDLLDNLYKSIQTD